MLKKIQLFYKLSRYEGKGKWNSGCYEGRENEIISNLLKVCLLLVIYTYNKILFETKSIDKK